VICVTSMKKTHGSSNVSKIFSVLSISSSYNADKLQFLCNFINGGIPCLLFYKPPISKPPLDFCGVAKSNKTTPKLNISLLFSELAIYVLDCRVKQHVIAQCVVMDEERKIIMMKVSQYMSYSFYDLPLIAPLQILKILGTLIA
jgi:hypothetical protein